MNKKERFELAKKVGFGASKQEVDDDGAAIEECYRAYTAYLTKHELEYDRHEFMRFAAGWRESMMKSHTKHGNTLSAPDLTLFFNKARDVENMMRIERELKLQEEIWFQAVERANMLSEVCEEIIGTGLLSDEQQAIVETTKELMEAFKVNIERNKVATKVQLDKIETHEKRISTIYNSIINK